MLGKHEITDNAEVVYSPLFEAYAYIKVEFNINGISAKISEFYGDEEFKKSIELWIPYMETEYKPTISQCSEATVRIWREASRIQSEVILGTENRRKEQLKQRINLINIFNK